MLPRGNENHYNQLPTLEFIVYVKGSPNMEMRRFCSKSLLDWNIHVFLIGQLYLVVVTSKIIEIRKQSLIIRSSETLKIKSQATFLLKSPTNSNLKCLKIGWQYSYSGKKEHDQLKYYKTNECEVKINNTVLSVRKYQFQKLKLKRQLIKIKLTN